MSTRSKHKSFVQESMPAKVDTYSRFLEVKREAHTCLAISSKQPA
jgi:hypothetical protein